MVGLVLKSLSFWPKMFTFITENILCTYILTYFCIMCMCVFACLLISLSCIDLCKQTRPLILFLLVGFP